MKKLVSPLLFLVALALFSCEPDLEFRNLEDFNVDDSLLQNGDEVELIYATGTPGNNNKDLDFFIHAIAVKKETGDTINILTSFFRGDGKGSSKNLFKFYFADSEEGLKIFDKVHAAEGKFSPEDVLKINKVVRDKRFDFVTKNNHPAIIGFIDK
jgi:hypothetical protein